MYPNADIFMIFIAFLLGIGTIWLFHNWYNT